MSMRCDAGRDASKHQYHSGRVTVISYIVYTFRAIISTLLVLRAFGIVEERLLLHGWCQVWGSFAVTVTWALGAQGRGLPWTPKVCRIMAFYRFWAIILPTFGGLGHGKKNVSL